MAAARPLEGFVDLHLIDTHFLEHEGHVAAYLFTGEEPAILDPGASTGVDRLLDALDRHGIDPAELRYILPSHLHLDHAGAVGYLARHCPNAVVVAHPMAVRFLSDRDRTRKLVESAHRALGAMAEGYGDLRALPADRFRAVEDGEVLTVGNRRLRALEATGHAPHQLCWFEERDRLLFTADEVGLWIDDRVFPVTPPPNFHHERNLESLRRFEKLEPDTLLFPHFGRRADAREGLREYASVLASWVDTVREHLERHGDPDRVVSEMVGETLPRYVHRWGEEYARATIETDVRGVLHHLRDED